MGKEKWIYAIITPEGRERLLGAYVSDGSALGACRRRFAADWLALSSGPFRLRMLRPGEKVKFGGEVTEEYGDGG